MISDNIDNINDNDNNNNNDNTNKTSTTFNFHTKNCRTKNRVKIPKSLR